MRLFWIINATLFQLCWWSAALINEHAVMIMSIALLLHLSLSPSKLQDIKLLPVAAVGVTCDQLLITIGVIDVNQMLIPTWLILLWIILAWSFNHSLAWLGCLKTWQVSLIGGALGSTSYLAAIKLGTITTPLALAKFMSIDVILWCVLLPLFVVMQRKLLRQKGHYHA